MKILAVSGSLRAGSYNTQLLRAAADAAPAGVEVELWEGIGDLPLYDQDLDGSAPPEPVRRLREDWARRGRDPVRDARVQRLRPRRAEERRRLGLPPAARGAAD